MDKIRSPLVFAGAALLAVFIGLNSLGNATITLGVARLILPTQIDVLVAFLLGVIAMVPFVLGAEPGEKNFIEQKKDNPKQLTSDREKQLEAEVAQLKLDLTKNKN